METQNANDNSFGQLTPRRIVKELDKYIIGQGKAKRAVAIAIRNRARRLKVSGELKNEISPKNIIMIGPTGVGKTEIARRLSHIIGASFVKVEATKFTEVGYVGRDVESMVRDLVNVSFQKVKNDLKEKVRIQAEKVVEKRILDCLIPPPAPANDQTTESDDSPEFDDPDETDSSSVDRRVQERYARTREKFLKNLRKGEFENTEIEIVAQEGTTPNVEIFSNIGMEEMDFNLVNILGNQFPKRSKRKKKKVSEARLLFMEEESEKLIDMEQAKVLAVEQAEEMGIIFIDEIDKIIANTKSSGGPDVSREGVQRDILPIVEGTSVKTRYGTVKTDHMLFIASGAFHFAKPTDLIPELQGRFPIRVELDSLKADDFRKILVKPKNALIKQYEALIETEGICLTFEAAAISSIAQIADDLNSKNENIGARRLHTILETLLDDISFNAPEMKETEIVITKDYVNEKLSKILKDEDLSKYIL